MLCDRSAKRFAQDDDFVGELAIHLVGYASCTKDLKCTGSQDDDFVEVLKKKHPKQLALLGRNPGLHAPSTSPVGTTGKLIGSGILNRGNIFRWKGSGDASRKLPVVPAGLVVLRISTQDCVLG